MLFCGNARPARLTRVTAATALAVATFAPWPRFAEPGAAAPTKLTLIYVGAQDCAPCRAWQNGDGAEFGRSADFARMTYREVKSQRLQDLLNDEHWPEDLRIFRNRLKPSDGAPLWLVVSGNDVVATGFGAAAWRTRVLPTLRSRLSLR